MGHLGSYLKKIILYFINEYKIRPIDNACYKYLGQKLLERILETMFPALLGDGSTAVILPYSRLTGLIQSFSTFSSDHLGHYIYGSGIESKYIIDVN